MSNPTLHTLALLEILRIDGAYNMSSQFWDAVQHARLLAKEHNIEIDLDVLKAEKVNSYIKYLYQRFIQIREPQGGIFPPEIDKIRPIIRSWSWWPMTAPEKKE